MKNMGVYIIHVNTMDKDSFLQIKSINIFFLILWKTYFVVTHQNCIIIQMSTQNNKLCFHGKIKKKLFTMYTICLLSIYWIHLYRLTPQLQIRRGIHIIFFLFLHNICFCGEIRKISAFFERKKVPYLLLCNSAFRE